MLSVTSNYLHIGLIMPCFNIKVTTQLETEL
jgi:hypothetical protein